MRRILEKLAYERKNKEDEFTKKLEELKNNSKNILAKESFLRTKNLLERLEEILKSRESFSPKKVRFLSRGLKTAQSSSSQEMLNEQVLHILQEIHHTLENNLSRTSELISSLGEIIQLNIVLTDAKDREWDALGSNHVQMIFKSMEWRIDKLAAAYEDASLLMKKFILLEDKMDRLLSTLEEKKLPSSAQAQEILQPLKDWRYAGFETRFRGSGEELKKQLAAYLPYFENSGPVVDLGCGRGEFIELCRDKGIAAEGVDINGQMIDICLDKGLNCQKADILDKLAEYEDRSLGGIFSSQVIEHLSPDYLRRLIALSYIKLASSGRLVLETINPASVFALVQIYFLDLSHQKPVHPQALKFLLESAGFEEVEIKFSAPLEEDQLKNLPARDDTASILNQNIDSLNKFLYAPPNYAAIGLKK